jgi:hypothetical protein
MRHTTHRLTGQGPSRYLMYVLELRVPSPLSTRGGGGMGSEERGEDEGG